MDVSDCECVNDGEIVCLERVESKHGLELEKKKDGRIMGVYTVVLSES